MSCGYIGVYGNDPCRLDIFTNSDKKYVDISSMPQRVSSPVAKTAIYDSNLGYKDGIEAIYDANPRGEIPGCSNVPPHIP